MRSDSFRIFAGRTTGTPIRLADPQPGSAQQGLRSLAETFRPDTPITFYTQKYGSATTAAAVVRRRADGGAGRGRCHRAKWLAERYGVAINGWMSQLGPIEIPFVAAAESAGNPFFAPNAAIVPQLENTWINCASRAIRSGRRSR